MKMISENHQEEQLRKKIKPPCNYAKPQEGQVILCLSQGKGATHSLVRAEVRGGQALSTPSCSFMGRQSSEFKEAQHINPQLVESHPLTSPESNLIRL